MMNTSYRVLVCLPLIALLAACGKKEAAAPAAPPATDVAVMTVKPADVPQVYEFVGQTESSQQVEIRARVAGFLERRIYTEGAMVSPGQTLFLIDAKPFQAELDAARAELNQQQARLTTARANLARVKPLVAQNALSQKDLDDATGQEQAAAAAVEAARAKVTNSELDLSYTTIKSPVAGLSSFAKVQDGAYVSGENSLLTYIAKLDPIRVNFSLSENEKLRLQSEADAGIIKPAPNDKWRVEVLLADGTVFPETGRITFADAAFSQETGTFLVRAELPNPKGALRPGQFVRVHVLGATRPNAIVVPQRAVQQGPRGQFVWVVDKDSKAEQRSIQTDEWKGDGWLVTKGLRAGDRVVVDGTLRLAPGVPLKPTEMPAQAASTASAPQAGGNAPAGAAAPSAPAPAPAPAAAPPAGAAPSAAAPASAANGGTAVYFEHGSSRLDATASVALRKLAASLTGGQTVAISGYVDKSGHAEANTKLAQARAQAVHSALTRAGVAADRIEMKKPADIVGGDDAAAARRVDVTVGAAR
ncbi:efflux RND transporter periplasmic adaptor subunit [Uliginosibacterium sp. sgz301328]|uniref:efflux RND transporter periplasmic adaptor subunit n=1 Tax=Uliginosibacterium sp. sgz301328 TaxID=3243764 RepID=UPI00359D050E